MKEINIISIQFWPQNSQIKTKDITLIENQYTQDFFIFARFYFSSSLCGHLGSSQQKNKNNLSKKLRQS